MTAILFTMRLEQAKQHSVAATVAASIAAIFAATSDVQDTIYRSVVFISYLRDTFWNCLLKSEHAFESYFLETLLVWIIQLMKLCTAILKTELLYDDIWHCR